MKVIILFMLGAIAVSALPTKKVDAINIEIPTQVTTENRNILVNLLIRQLINFLRGIINNGSPIFGIPPLDPLDIEQIHIELPTNNFLTLYLEILGGHTSGIGGFVVHKSDLNLKQLTFNLDISVPKLIIKADNYNLKGDLFKALPLYGDGISEFVVENFRFQSLLYLKQSSDGLSVILDKLENTAFQLPKLNVKLSGVIGGGNIDTIVNSLIEDVIINYVNRFQGAIAKVASIAALELLNPILDKLDTWKFIENLL